MTADIVKAALLLGLAATLQISFVDFFELVDGTANVVLLCLTGLALLRGPIFGAAAGFYAGLLLDLGTLGTLGLSSLLLTIAGYWAGRFGEATSDRRNQVARILLAVGLLTVGVAVGSLIVHLLLGEAAAVGDVLARELLPELLLNLVLALPAYALCKRLFPPNDRKPRELVSVQEPMSEL